MSSDSVPESAPTPPAPVFTVTHGNPTPEELAALVAVLTARGRQPQPQPNEPARTNSAGWSAYWRGVRAPLHPGPGAWRASGRR
ncbi:acyl-CoA carboxylase subunit epsilon [Microlunatus panaciterrae]|uniref:Acyl-CoA carboxylase epsilon subunit n=1 Tax=Microlunatus panaciterrae TaxID=400768 RepID=A0ABS2RL59_9ACTN|nr:acyl-CoA carboxylase subunit epsilon [Microlunatus panaciterrae]MBM7799740.1 hypothetical protein [Microlunatus panaciterrae]